MLASPLPVNAKTITIAVIDTGVDRSVGHLCKYGHKSFVDNEDDPFRDTYGHGTHIAGLIVQNAGESGYCIVSIKFYSELASGYVNAENLEKAIQYAVNIKADFINVSAGGPNPSSSERDVVKEALEQGTKVVVAAGNEHNNLDAECNFYPACYDNRIITVGNLANDSIQTYRQPSSNYGNYVKRWEIGTNVESNLPHGRRGYNTGTSQAAAVATGKLVRNELDK
jgi:subtilisin family serine protease